MMIATRTRAFVPCALCPVSLVPCAFNLPYRSSLVRSAPPPRSPIVYSTYSLARPSCALLPHLARPLCIQPTVSVHLTYRLACPSCVLLPCHTRPSCIQPTVSLVPRALCFPASLIHRVLCHIYDVTLGLPYQFSQGPGGQQQSMRTTRTADQENPNEGESRAPTQDQDQSQRGR
jgi:hypothetical protein